MSNEFLSNSNLLIYALLFLFWLLSIILEQFISKKMNTNNFRTHQDWSIYVNVFLASDILVYLSYQVDIGTFFLLPYAVFYIGVILTILGIILRYTTALTNRKFFLTQKLDSNNISNSTHPAYYWGLLGTLGLILCFGSIIGPLIYCTILLLGYLIRQKSKKVSIG